MDLMELGAIGELVGGLAVVITLIYLAVQVRGNMASEKAETHRAFVAEWNRTFWGPFRDVESANLMRRAATDFDALNDDEKTVACAWFFGTMNLGQEADALRRIGSVDDEYAGNLEPAIAAVIQMPGFARWWEGAEPLFGASFRARLSKRLAAPTRPPSFSDYVPSLLTHSGAEEQP